MSVFVTHVTWQNMGGFPGMIMSTRDQGVTSMNVYGPELVEEFAEHTRYFVGRKKIKLVTPYSEGIVHSPVCEDENIKITTVPLYSEEPTECFEVATPQVKRKKIECFNQINTAAFVCKFSDVRGKFDLGKAKALGLSPGPMYGRLQRGENVISPNGETIHPDDVLGPIKRGPVMIVIECPNEHYISSVLSNPILRSDSFTAVDHNVALIVHMSPASVVKNKKFQEWMLSFGPGTKHLMLHETMSPPEIALRRNLKIQFPLHLMNPSVYHSPVNTFPCFKKSTEFDKRLDSSIIHGQTFLKYHLKPAHKIGADLSSTVKPLENDYKDLLKDIESSKEMVDAIESSQPNTLGPNAEKNIFKIPDTPLISNVEDVENPIITFLGTGSAAPTCYRTVSGILIRTSTAGNFLLDCGEGSLTQIYRCFGKKAGDEIVRNISGVFISHIHGDHHLGVPGILVRRSELTSDSKDDVPFVIAPQTYLSWLESMSKNCQLLSFRKIRCEDLETESTSSAQRYKQEVSFLAVPVIHCNGAYGVVMKHCCGWSIVYSGDTRPCKSLVKAGRKATLLIHEATFDDDMLEDAKTKMHSTFGEALDISSSMDPEFTLMTHFSNRYPKVPSVLMDSRVHSKVGIALDCMSIGLKDIASLYSHLPAMKQVFNHVMETEDIDTDKVVAIQDWNEEEGTKGQLS